MPRVRRFLQDGLVYHVLNRGNKRARIFEDGGDYSAFLTTLVDAADLVPMRLLAYCLMPNHWHLVLWPAIGRDLSVYMHRMMNLHVRRHQTRHGTTGLGHLYQGRFKSFPVETGYHLLTVLRYVEANAAKANLVTRAEDWSWSSLARRASEDGRPLVVAGPVERPPNWLSLVNEGFSPEALFAVRRAGARQLPFGTDAWSQQVRGDRQS